MRPFGDQPCGDAGGSIGLVAAVVGQPWPDVMVTSGGRDVTGVRMSHFFFFHVVIMHHRLADAGV